MTTPPQQDAPTMFYPLNPCGHLRGPGGGCIGSPECKREPVSADKLGELVGVDLILSRGSAEAEQARKWWKFRGQPLQPPDGSSERAQDENQTPHPVLLLP
jgi:hypothetical protein